MLNLVKHASVNSFTFATCSSRWSVKFKKHHSRKPSLSGCLKCCEVWGPSFSLWPESWAKEDNCMWTAEHELTQRGCVIHCSELTEVFSVGRGRRKRGVSKKWNTIQYPKSLEHCFSMCSSAQKDLNSIQSPYNFCFPISTLVRVVTLIKANEQMDIETSGDVTQQQVQTRKLTSVSLVPIQSGDICILDMKLYEHESFTWSME